MTTICGICRLSTSCTSRLSFMPRINFSIPLKALSPLCHMRASFSHHQQRRGIPPISRLNMKTVSLLNYNRRVIPSQTLNMMNSLHRQIIRTLNSQPKSRPSESKRTTSMMIYIFSTAIVMVGVTYAGVPLYRMFCQSTGLGGELKKGVQDTSKIETMNPVRERVIRVRFNADIASSMQWNFRPHQSEIKVLPGETALAFYKAKNPSDKPVVGISTYNVVPFEAGQYFNKIQCFCFEEQRLNPHEEVDMPVFFYIDPEYCEDPALERVNTITLSYTFFEAKEGMSLPLPGYQTH